MGTLVPHSGPYFYSMLANRVRLWAQTAPATQERGSNVEPQQLPVLQPRLRDHLQRGMAMGRLGICLRWRSRLFETALVMVNRGRKVSQKIFSVEN